MRIFIPLVASALLASSTSLTAQNILASANGMTATAPPTSTGYDQNCPGRVIVNADTPATFFDPNNFSNLIAGIRVSRIASCDDREILRDFEIWGIHDGHFLDMLSIRPNGDIMSANNAHPNLQRMALSQKRVDFEERFDNEYKGTESNRDTKLEEAWNFWKGRINNGLGLARFPDERSFNGQFSDFPYLPDNWYSLGSGGTHPPTRYTDIQFNLVGKTYLFYEFQNAEMNSHLKEDRDPVPLDERLPRVGITIGANGVDIFTENQHDRVGYSSMKTREKGSVSCFVSGLIGSELCLSILRTEASYFQPYFLSYVTPNPDHKGRIRFDFETLGYLKDTTLEIAKAELEVVAALEEIAELQDTQHTKDGTAKKSISFSSRISPGLSEMFEEAYSGEFSPKVTIPLEITFIGGGRAEEALLREAMFLAYHQAVGFSCLATMENPRKIFNFLNTTALSSANPRLLNSAAFVRYLSQPIGIDETYFEAYEALATLHLLKTHFNYISTRQDFSFTRTLDITNERLASASAAASELISVEGCNSPTLKLFERRLSEYAFTDDDIKLYGSLR